MRQALGVINLDKVINGDSEWTRARIRGIANDHHLHLRDTLTYRDTDSGWLFRLLETVHRFSIHTVIATTATHIGDARLAVVGVADFLTLFEHTPYVGYGVQYVRPSDCKLLTGGVR